MYEMRILIIGGGAAGTTAATRLRRLNENDEILILEKDDEIYRKILLAGMKFKDADKSQAKKQHKCYFQNNLDKILDTTYYLHT